MARILVIDDQEDITALTKLMLEEEGHKVACCNNSSEVSDLLGTRHFDLLILDVLMPGKNGFVLAEEIKQHYDEMQIIVMSGGGRTMDSQTAIKAAGIYADFKLQKPFTPLQLNLAVDALLATRMRIAS